MFRCIGRIVTIFALCSAIGLHWLTLQSIAWTSMIIDYSKRGTLCQAIAQTFDGAHPCSLCRVVNKANSTEKKSDLQVLTPKVDMICVWRTPSSLRPFIPFEYTVRDFCSSQIGRSPPVPPPRSLLS
ncbi:MAG: hypothetical protein WA849_01010 [Candidatus Udaeobacter sp.]